MFKMFCVDLAKQIFKVYPLIIINVLYTFNKLTKSVNLPSDPLNGRRFQKMKEKRLV